MTKEIQPLALYVVALVLRRAYARAGQTVTMAAIRAARQGTCAAERAVVGAQLCHWR